MVTNEQFNEVYSRPEIKKIINKAIKKFRFLDSDELESCKLIGLWKALESNRGDILLTTSVYNHVTWQCKDRAKLLCKNTDTSQIPRREESNDSDIFDLISDIGSTPNGQLIIEKVIDNLSLHEIGRKRNISTEAVRIRIKKAINFIIEQDS